MGPDGYAAGGVARPGCHCKACDVTNTDRSEAGYGRMDGLQATLDPLHAQRTAREWSEATELHYGLNAGVYGLPTLDSAGVAV